MIVAEIPKEERPREKANRYGIKVLSNVELLAILLRHGYRGNSSLSVAEDVLRKANGIGGLSQLTDQDLMSVKGIKTVKATEILACFELARRMSYEKGLNRDVVKDPSHLVKWLRQEIGILEQENFLVVFLNVKNHILNYKVIFKGTVDRSLVHPREIFKEALLVSASKLLLVHNHPSGDLTPSEADMELTIQLGQCAEMMGMKVLDHLIVSRAEWLSFKEIGLI